MALFLYNYNIIDQVSEIYNNFKFDNDTFEIVSDELSVQIRQKKKGNGEELLEERPYFIKKHHSMLDIKKSIYYFFLNSDRYHSITFHKEEIFFYFHYENRNNYIKEHAKDKRVNSEISIRDLEECLLYYKNGSVMNEKNGSTSIANKEDFMIQGHAFDTNLLSSKYRAMLEYLERSAASVVLPNTITTSFQDIYKQAINPRLFGTYDEDCAKRYNLVPYHDDLEVNWVKGTSLYSNKEYYVPEQVTQYLIQDMANKFIVDSSNGCAIGNSMEEAALYAILEVIERDVFMKYWFGDLTIEKIIYEDKNLLSKELYFQTLGYDVSFYYITNATNVPVVWCLLTSQKEENPIYSITGLGCHINIHDAMYSSFAEVYNSFVTLMNNGDREELISDIKRVGNSGEVTACIDHLYYFASYKSKDFLVSKTKNVKAVHVSSLAKKITNMNLDIRDDLHSVLEQIKFVYEDVIIVDQTNPFLESISLKCVKAMLLGAIPLDFSSDLIRKTDDEVSRMKIQWKNLHPLA